MIIFAPENRENRLHLGIKTNKFVYFAFDLHYLCTRKKLKENLC